MASLAYLLSAPLSTAPGAGSEHGKPPILFGGRATDEGDEEHLQRFSNILLGLPREATFAALHESLPFKWNPDEGYDQVNPFGDDRDFHFHALWTFDIPNDVLRHTNHQGCRQILLATLRKRVVSLADMELLGGPFPLRLESTLDFEPPSWKPQAKVDARISAFVRRLLRDFHHQWRHVLRNHYNDVTLRVLARAIIRLSTLDFEVRPNIGGHGPRGAHVWITKLPTWDPCDAGVVCVGRIFVVLCQTIREGLSTVRQHVSSSRFDVTKNPGTTASGDAQAHYMILSVKHIMLCRATGPDSLQHTAPEPLFNGDYDVAPPSDLALEYLLWATASARPSIRTSLHSLPVEVQDMILNFGSVGTVLAAHNGCLLGLGSPFLWKDGPLIVTLEERYTIRPTGSSVESQIWFGEHKSGIVYLNRLREQ